MSAVFEQWTISRKITVGFAVMAVITAVASIAGTVSLSWVIASKDAVIEGVGARRLTLEEMRVYREKRAKSVRSYLIAKQEKYAEQVAEFKKILIERGSELRAASENQKERRLVETMIDANAEMQVAWEEVMQKRRSGVPLEDLQGEFDRNQAVVKALDEAMTNLADYEDAQLAGGLASANGTANNLMVALVTIAVVAASLAAFLAMILRRSVVGSVGAAVHNVQSSSTELQSSAAQQASSSQELASTTAEISTTIRELLATSRQITESAQRVVKVAQETGSVANAGNATGQRANDAVDAIRSQVDVIVAHMLELGRRAQQIGSILDLINELAEQTNILSINATIEAAGAGEGGRRFAVVADEIRRLADRVGGSAREIRTIIDEIRASANTTVMATEDGRKAVDAGTRQFSDVISSFNDINQRVTVTAEAAREIELSIRQQATAVEQVNNAVAGMAQAAKETEASAGQTLETAEQLTQVSQELGALIWAKEAS